MVQMIMIELSENKKIEKSLFNYIKFYDRIEILLNQYLKGADEWIKKLKSFFDYSEFIFKLEKSESSKKEEYILLGLYKYNNDNNSNNNISSIFASFFQSDLDSMFQKIFITKIPGIYKDIFKSFVSFYNKINKLLNILNELYVNGYHTIFNITIIIVDSKISCTINNKSDNLDSIINNLSLINKTISEKLNKFYEENKFIRFFYPKQLIDIYNSYIINYNVENKSKIKALFNIYFNNLIKQIGDYESLEFVTNSIIFKKDEVEKYFEILTIINKYISAQLDSNKINLQNIYEINGIKINEKPLHSQNFVKKKKEKNFEGIFFSINSNNNQEVEALNIYYYMTFNFPINTCFLYCSKNTSDEELKYFLLRCFLCEYYVLFCMINIDLLNYNLRRSLVKLLKKYIKKYKRFMKSCLLLMINSKDDELKKIIIKQKSIQAFPNYNKKFEIIQKYKATLINSKFCGIGKSQSIKKEIDTANEYKKNNEKINYIYFPIGGKFDKIKFSERIDKLPDMSDTSKKYAIHFEIAQIKDFLFLNEFFFKLIVLRKYDINSLKHFGDNVEIIIEIPNDFINYKKEIKILEILNKKTLNQISKLVQSNDLLFVAKILKIYENNDILKPQNELNKIFSKMSLSLDECENIIFKYLNHNKLENPNYYQINIFIKILYEEFNKFYNCEAYSSDNLSINSIGTYLRKFIIYSLIQMTNLFIISPYEKLIKNQELNQKDWNENDEEKQEKNINEQLEIKIDSISFDNIKPSLIVFNEDGNSSTIISTCSEKDEEFINLNKICQTQSHEKLKNFKELSGEEIFTILTQFLNVTGYFSKKEEAEKILGTYVYTTDNFIKVVLILMRIRMNIPVILMGETGCGKTKLIEMASQLINRGENKIEKINIHAGIQDEDIIEFMKNLNYRVQNEDKKLLNKKINDFENLPLDSKNAYLKNNSKNEIYSQFEKEIKNRKIWIFFDEINTCNSMGLLTEIMVKNSIYGEPLDPRYVYISACNPYRVAKKENFLLNVLYKKNQKKKNLVYTVNPLPMSLMNFVFNFGSLKPDDEFAYIKSMVRKNVYKIFEKEKNNKLKEELIKIETNCVKLCQDFVKKNNYASIVSLREINRFNIFLEFFSNYLFERKCVKEKGIKSDFEMDEIYKFYSEINDKEIYFHKYLIISKKLEEFYFLCD